MNCPQMVSAFWGQFTVRQPLKMYPETSEVEPVFERFGGNCKADPLKDTCIGYDLNNSR